MAAQAGQTEIAKRYATAFFALAKEVQAIDAVADDLAALKAMVGESHDLDRLMDNPLLSRVDQGRALRAVSQKAQFHDLTQKFLGTLAQNRRLALLDVMIEAVCQQIANHRGEVTADVASATPLTDTQKETIAKTLSTSLGRTVSLQVTTDPDLLGGLVVRVGSKRIDSSVKTKLERLHRRLKQGTNLHSTNNQNVKEVA